MLRIGMILMGDVRHDARVLREARTLAGIGHHVRLAVVGSGDGSAAGPVVGESPFDVVEVALRIALPAHVQWLWRPWRLRRRIDEACREALRRGVRGWLTIVVLGAAIIASLPWIAARGVLQIALRAIGRSGSGVDWLLWWRYVVGEWGVRAGRAVGSVDVWHAHDLPGLIATAAATAQSGAIRPLVVYDSHEIYLEARTNGQRPRWARRIVAGRERRLAGRAFALVTVNSAVATELNRRIEPRRTVVVHNCPPRWSPPPTRRNQLRVVTGIPSESPVILYHGGFLPHRGLAEVAEAILEPGLERAHLVYLGFGRERPALERLAADRRFDSRVHVLRPVPPEQLLEWIAGADVDVMAIAPSTLNHRLSTPNKLFESLAAGVPVVVSDLAGMRGIVCDDPAGPLGSTCDPGDPASIAAAIRSILDRPAEEQAALRLRCLEAAHARWNWETESERLIALYGDVERALREPALVR